MNKKEYLEKREALLAEADAAINAGEAAKAEALHADVTALDETFEKLATLSANQAALNGNAVAVEPVAPVVLNRAPIASVADTKANEEDLYKNAFAHFLMGVKMSASEQGVFEARNATSTVKENYVVVPATMKQGIWGVMEDLHPVIADTVKTFVPGDLDILVETTAGNDAAWYTEASSVSAEKVVNAKITLKGCELAKAIEVSWKLKKMAVDEFLAYVAKRIGEKMANSLAAALISGAGIGNGTTDTPKPLGVVTKLEAESDTPQVSTYTAVNGIKYGDLTTMRSKIKAGYAGKAVFYANAACIWTRLANILDADNRPIFIPDATQGGVGRIFGIPVKEEAAIPDNAVLLANMADGYACNVNEDITMYTEDHVLSRTTDYMGYCLIDGQPITTKAFAYLKKSE